MAAAPKDQVARWIVVGLRRAKSLDDILDCVNSWLTRPNYPQPERFDSWSPS